MNSDDGKTAMQQSTESYLDLPLREQMDRVVDFMDENPELSLEEVTERLKGIVSEEAVEKAFEEEADIFLGGTAPASEVMEFLQRTGEECGVPYYETPPTA